MTCFKDHLATALMAGVAFVAAPAVAQSALDQEHAFSVPNGPLEDSLLTLAEQGGIQLLYDSDVLPALQAPAVTGRVTLRQALAIMLRGAGVEVREVRPGVIVLARAQVRSTSSEPLTTLDAVVVTGSLLPSSGGPASPVLTLSRDGLDRTGRNGVADALNALPQNFGGSSTPASLLTGADPLGTNVGLANGVNLRGLGADATLVLVNGRRMAGSGLQGDFADVSAIPSSAVERIDVLLDGASALYGSDAVGGVVNVILRRNFEGHETRARASVFDGGKDWSLAHTVGARWRSGSLLASHEMRHNDALNADDRAYTRSGDLRAFGGSDRRQFYSVPGNIMGLNAEGTAFVPTSAIIPQPGGGTSFDSGRTNLTFRQAGVDILPKQDTHSSYVRVDQNLSAAARLSADFRINDRSFAYRSLSPAGIATVTAANPYFQSPSGAASHQVAYNFIEESGPSLARGESISQGATLGVEIDLGSGRDLEIYGAWAGEDSQSRQEGMLHDGRLREALGAIPDDPATPFSTASDGFLNLFGGGQANGSPLVDFVTFGYFQTRTRSESASLNALFRSPLIELGGGSLDLAVGALLRKERFAQLSETFLYTPAPTVSASPAYERRAGAVFAEIRAPFFSELNARPGLERLDLSLALRHERYDDVGSTTTPKVGLVWSPVQGLSLRSTWGESFRAPPLTAVAAPAQITVVNVPDGAVDRLTLLAIGGNLDLAPEQASTFTAGFDAEIARWRFGASWFDVRFEDRIGRPGLEGYEAAFSDPSLAPFARRLDPSVAEDRAELQTLLDDPGFLLPGVYPVDAFSAAIDGRWVNASSVEVRGLDASAQYGFQLADGEVELHAQASYIVDYVRQVTATAPSAQLVGRQGFPADLRGSLTATWTAATLNAGVTLNHVGAYRDVTGDTIEAWNTADVHLGWSPAAPAFAGLRLNVGVRNLFDAEPPFFNAPSGFGFDPGQADPLGRTAYLQLIKRW